MEKNKIEVKEGHKCNLERPKGGSDVQKLSER